MKKILVLLMIASGSAYAELGGQAIAEGRRGLGCAYPGIAYTLTVTSNISDFNSAGEADREVTMHAKSGRLLPYQFDCTGTYAGVLEKDGGNYFGGLQRVEWSCEGVDQERANAIFRDRVDPFVLEAEGVELAVEILEDGYSTRQLAQAPDSDRWPCDKRAYPTYTFVRQ